MASDKAPLMVNLFLDRNLSHLFQYIVSTTILAVEKIFFWRLKCNSMKYNCFVPKEKKKKENKKWRFGSALGGQSWDPLLKNSWKPGTVLFNSIK